MRFADMIAKYDDDIINELPSDIVDIIKNVKLPEIPNTEDLLNCIWNKTKNICKKHIENKWFINIGIDEAELFEDIKYHSIFMIYLSIIDQQIEPKCIKKCIEENYKRQENKNKDLQDMYSNFHKKWKHWFNSMQQVNYNDGIFYSDLHYCFYKDMLNRNENCEKRNNEYNIYIDSEIFYEVINNWKDCPYNNKNLTGITFRKLDKFYERLDNIVNSSTTTLDKTIKAFTIERLFNISFLQELSKYIHHFTSNLELPKNTTYQIPRNYQY